MARGTDDRILGDGVIVRIVQILLPLIDIRRAGLNRHRPAATTVTDIRHALRSQNTQNLRHRKTA